MKSITPKTHFPILPGARVRLTTPAAIAELIASYDLDALEGRHQTDFIKATIAMARMGITNHWSELPYAQSYVGVSLWPGRQAPAGWEDRNPMATVHRDDLEEITDEISGMPETPGT